MLFVVGMFALAGYPMQRLAVLATLCGVSLVCMQLESKRLCAGCAPAFSPLHFMITGTVVAIIVVTGGINSPMIPIFLGSQILVAISFGRSRETMVSMMISSAFVVVIALLPASWLGPPLSPPFDKIMLATAILYAINLFSVIARAQTEAVRQAGESLERMREDLLVHSLERTRSLESVGSKIAHELKNPLSAIKALVQLIARGVGQEPRTQERLAVIGGEVERMERIMNEYMSFTRPLEDLRPESVGVSGLVDEVIGVLEARALDRGVKLSRDGEAGTVAADRRRLKDALFNIASNALEATPRGGTVQIELASRADGVEIVVRDSGEGMTAETLARLGTPFFTTRQGGTGLGVVLARTTIEQHGGEVQYTGDVGRGTTVRVHLPRVARPCVLEMGTEARRTGDGQSAAGR